MDRDALNRSLPRNQARTLRGLASMVGRGPDRRRLLRQLHHSPLPLSVASGTETVAEVVEVAEPAIQTLRAKRLIMLLHHL